MSRTVILPGAFLLAGLAFVFPRTLAAQVKANRAETAEAPAVKAETLSTDARLRALLGSPGDERRIPERLRHRNRAMVQQIAAQLRGGASFEDVRESWVALTRRTRPRDVDALIQWVMREAYGEQLAAQRQTAAGERRMQQTLQTMSNVSRSMHDTAKASIQNMRG